MKCHVIFIAFYAFAFFVSCKNKVDEIATHTLADELIGTWKTVGFDTMYYSRDHCDSSKVWRKTAYYYVQWVWEIKKGTEDNQIVITNKQNYLSNSYQLDSCLIWWPSSKEYQPNIGYVIGDRVELKFPMTYNHIPKGWLELKNGVLIGNITDTAYPYRYEYINAVLEMGQDELPGIHMVKQ